MSGVSKSKNEDFGRDLGLVHEAVVTCRKADWNRETWVKIQANENLCRDILALVEGRATLVEAKTPPRPQPIYPRKRLVEFYQFLLGKGSEAQKALRGVKFQSHADGHEAHMLVLPGLQLEVVLAAICQKWSLAEPRLYRELSEIDPAGTRNANAYIFRYIGGDGPDQVGRQSNEELENKREFFMTLIKYLLTSAYHKYLHGCYFDLGEWTVLDTRWWDGQSVYARWDVDRLHLASGPRYFGNLANVPRYFDNLVCGSRSIRAI